MNAEAIAAAFFARWEDAWQSGGASEAARLYTGDAVLVGASIAIGREEIAGRLAQLHNAGWTRIAIRPVNARLVGGLVLVAAEFKASGLSTDEGRTLSGRSSHALTKVGDE
jgi:uncharacterized protein (TIGR02246 family)